MNLILLAVIGIVEALVYLDRIRTATGASVWRSALSALMVTTSRIAFVIVGASSVLADTPWYTALACYAVPATLATVAVHGRPAGVRPAGVRPAGVRPATIDANRNPNPPPDSPTPVVRVAPPPKTCCGNCTCKR